MMRTVSTAEQEAFWNHVAGPMWVAAEEETERHTRPFGEVALAVAAPAPGESVLDVGCGCGSTTVALAHAVGATGRVLGVDLSAPMLERAAERAAGAPAPVELRRGDAQQADLGAGTFDLVFSRFGVMFFADPVAAFANLAGALTARGRLVFVCWQAPSANPWMAVVNRAVGHRFGLVPPPHDAPGPFSLADADHCAAILECAGLHDVAIRPHEERLHLGAGQPLEEWVHQRVVMGPARQPYLDADPDRQREIRAELAGALSAYRADPDDLLSGVVMDAAAWVVSARH